MIVKAKGLPAIFAAPESEREEVAKKYEIKPLCDRQRAPYKPANDPELIHAIEETISIWCCQQYAAQAIGISSDVLRRARKSLSIRKATREKIMEAVKNATRV